MQNLATLVSAVLEIVIANVKIENGSCDPEHAPFMGGLPSVS